MCDSDEHQAWESEVLSVCELLLRFLVEELRKGKGGRATRGIRYFSARLDNGEGAASGPLKESLFLLALG